MAVLKVKLLSEAATLPRPAHVGDSGLDLFSAEDASIPPGAVVLVKTGIAVELPPGCEGQIRPRSGLALEHHVTVLNSPGTIDNGYRGEVGVILANHGDRSFQVRQGMRVAQLVVAPFVPVAVEATEKLSRTGRSDAAFGSSGD